MAESCAKCDVLDRELRAIRELNNERFRAVEISTQAAATALASRLEDMNNWRAQLDRERTNFVQVSMWQTKHEALEADMHRLETWQNRIDGVFKFLWFLGATGLIALVISILRLFRVIAP